MISFIAVVFFCIKGECYFYNGQTLHNSEQSCIAEIKKFDQELKKNKIDSFFSCIRVPLTGA